MLKWPASTLQVQLPKDKPGFVQFSAGMLRRRQVVKQVGANYYSAALLESEVEVKNVTLSLGLLSPRREASVFKGLHCTHGLSKQHKTHSSSVWVGS